MISVEQILLLQQKVEGAVQKIERLKSENDALRTKCSELTKALSEKSELLSSFSADEKKIEDGILNALSRLDSVENNLLNQAGQSAMQNTAAAPETESPAPKAQADSAAQSGAETYAQSGAERHAEEPAAPAADSADAGESEGDLFGDITAEDDSSEEAIEPSVDIF